MKTDDNSLKSLKLIKVEREKNKKSTDKIHIEVEVKTIFENLTVAKFSPKDITNLKTDGKEPLNILRFCINLIPRGDNLIVAKIPEPLIGEFEIIKSKDVQFVFDDDANSILVVEAKIIGTRPDGAKRKVITYEDSDEIDEAID
jgi:hypothetical protein